MLGVAEPKLRSIVMQIHTALPMVRLGGIEGVDPLFLPKYKIGRSLQHAVMTSAASSKKVRSHDVPTMR